MTRTKKPSLRANAHLVMEACIERGLHLGISHALLAFDLLEGTLREDLTAALLHACSRELANAFYEDFEWLDVQ
jgi:hypothetical protein